MSVESALIIFFLVFYYAAHCLEKDHREKSARLWEIERRLGMHEKQSENDYDKYF